MTCQISQWISLLQRAVCHPNHMCQNMRKQKTVRLGHIHIYVVIILNIPLRIANKKKLLTLKKALNVVISLLTISSGLVTIFFRKGRQCMWYRSKKGTWEKYIAVKQSTGELELWFYISFSKKKKKRKTEYPFKFSSPRVSKIEHYWNHQVMHKKMV